MWKLRMTISIYFLLTLKSYNSMQIEDLKLSKCSEQEYPVTVTNITVQFGLTAHVKITGSLSTEVDLVGPIKASVELRRRIVGLWIKVPCEDNMGSCTYKNLCDYGYPTNSSCPEAFKKNNVPCRCPIKKGNYTILPSVDVFKQTSILSGTYKGVITVTQNGQFLSCYSVYFVLKDNYSQEYSVQMV